MPIKVLHALNMVGPKAGGPTRVLMDMTKAQAGLGYEVTVISTDRDLPSSSNVDQSLIRAQFAPAIRVLLFPVEFAPLLVSSAMGHWVKAHIQGFDIVHVHGCYRYPATMAARIARLRKVPYIIRPHGTFDPFLINKSSKSVWLKRLYELMFDFPNLRKAGGVHCTSVEELRTIDALKLGAPGFVVSNGVDWSIYEHLPARGGFRARLGIAPEVTLLLFLGRINFKKGLDLLIPAFALLRQHHPAAKLLIAGPDNDGYGAQVRGMVAAAELADAVIFSDAIFGRDVLGAYQDSDLFVLPSYGENFGMTVIEALACGTPVLISDKVNIFEDVVASGSGVASPCEVMPLANAMIELMGDPARRAAMAACARPWVEANFAWSSIVRLLDTQYREVIQNHGRWERASGCKPFV
jgi:glycosyltransferase involved in cell wall biosynthesis